jgi:hypothetical protein
MVVVDSLRDVITRVKLVRPSARRLTAALVVLLSPGQEPAKEALMNAGIEAIDSYLTSGTDNSVFDEPSYRMTMNNDLNAFLKWEKLGKNEADCPRLRQLLAVAKAAMATRVGGQASARQLITEAIEKGSTAMAP